MCKVLVVAALAVVVGGCGPQKLGAARLVPFDEQAYAGTDRQGTGKIVGQAFMKTRAGDVKLGAGNMVYISPVTPYSTESFERSVVNGEVLEPGDERAMKYLRTTQADAGGNFEFTGLPAGDYYARCWITWEVPDRYGTDVTGGWVGKKVTVREGETTKVMLTR